MEGLENKNIRGKEMKGNINIGGVVDSQLYINHNNIDIEGIYTYVKSEMDEIYKTQGIITSVFLLAFIVPYILSLLSFLDGMYAGIAFISFLMFGHSLMKYEENKKNILKSNLSLIVPILLLYYPLDERTRYIENIYRKEL